MTDDPPRIAAQFGKHSATVAAPPTGSVRQLAEDCAAAFALDPQTVKLLVPAHGMLRLDDDRTLAEAGEASVARTTLCFLVGKLCMAMLGAFCPR